MARYGTGSDLAYFCSAHLDMLFQIPLHVGRLLYLNFGDSVSSLIKLLASVPDVAYAVLDHTPCRP